MDNSLTSKETLKRKNREESIKHYILGYILECVRGKNRDNLKIIEDFLVNKLEIITEETFIYCIYRARVNSILFPKDTKSKYKSFRKSICVIHYDIEKQLDVLKKLAEFAETYKDGYYIKPNMIQCSFVKKDEDFK